MRVIAGKARRIPLKTAEGFETRPTTDRIKETLFNIIQDDISGSRFLDLFSGSGAIGIEALSRGAKEAYFVENQKKAVACIRENLEKTKLTEGARILCQDAASALKQLEQEKKAMDIIFMDPPYNRLLEKDMLDILKNSLLADSHTLIIIEADLNTAFDYAASMGFEILREKIYKTNKHIFLQKIQDGE